MAIVFTTALAAILICTGDLEKLADTTVLLLLVVFFAVNVSVLVLRKDTIDKDHFVAPSWLPVVGAVTCVVLMTQKEADSFLRAGLLLLLGLVFWVITRVVAGREDDIDAEELA